MKTEVNFKEVVLMSYAPDELSKMHNLNAIWLKTKDIHHKNILAYSTNIVVDDINESCPRKFIYENEFFNYTDEFNNSWLVSESMSVTDLDKFFKAYFNTEELVA